MEISGKYIPKHKIRIVTAASLFDGHDAAINIIRRLLQNSGAEVIHLGHNRSVNEIVQCAIEEDVQAIAITSYQGGHIEFFKYMYDLLNENKCGHIKIFGGGGGVILPNEIEELHRYGIAGIYSPDDGRRMGLQGMINDLLMKSDFPSGDIEIIDIESIRNKNRKTIGQTISAFENGKFNSLHEKENQIHQKEVKKIPVIGITGTGGAGKSSLVDELVRRFLIYCPEKYIGIVSVDPSKRKTGGALLGDRIRMNSLISERTFFRSLATREWNKSLSKNVVDAVQILKIAGFDLVLVESSGIGQSGSEIVDISDFSMYVMTPEYGAATQLEKIDMLDFAEIVAINKFDKSGAGDALRDVRKQFARNHERWHDDPETMPIYPTIASQYDDPGLDRLFEALMKKAGFHLNGKMTFKSEPKDISLKKTIIPPNKSAYLSEISSTIRQYNQNAENQSEIADNWYGLKTVLEMKAISKWDENMEKTIHQAIQNQKQLLDIQNVNLIENWEKLRKDFKKEEFVYKVRGKEIKVETNTQSLSGTKIPKIVFPGFKNFGSIVKWAMQENFPGVFPYTAGVFPFKREGEDPTRMFAGEGGPERTNKRFHYLSKGMPAVRLSTAYDSVTLYGENPDLRPDIYGKIGNSGVSVTCLDDAKKLYSGFRLTDAKTSVSMTINGPAPMMVAFFMNAAIDQECEIYIREHGMVEEVEHKIDQIYKKKGALRPKYNGTLPEGNNGLGLMLIGVSGEQVLPLEIYNRIKAETISTVRGTVQADILKEDQAQNTCIYSTTFALKMMGDIQEYFIKNKVRNFYSVSISGYHIAEAGANPVTQLAFTLANGFTYVEYYLSRGMHIDDFAPNLSFFFSNGLDPEYAVLGRVARRIWAKAIKIKYGGNERSQMLKYHIQTSGRSLHAQEIEFNDIRTTLQAVYAIYDNCNSLHTNAFDEAITTPTEDSVRRAMAIQLIINKEFGLVKNENSLQGSFIIEKLTDLVEEAVLEEFDRISERGGVLGAMEHMYQRNKIQEESLYYETLKNNGKLPLIGVNTFLSGKGSPTIVPEQVIRSTTEEKDYQLNTIKELHKVWVDESEKQLKMLENAASSGENIFDRLMEAAKYCSLGQITNALFEVGGKYRRNM
ncbi:MAG: methylmalonyl-CoA mutase family protein [Bacteroidales bacterium]